MKSEELTAVINKKCPYCKSDNLHASFCGKTGHTLHCFDCDACFYDRETEDYWESIKYEN